MNDITEHQHDAEIDRYLKDRMSAAEKAAFEVRILEEPELLERVQLLEALQVELNGEEDSLLAGDTAVASSNVLPFRGWVRQPLSLAASVLVAVLGVSLLAAPPETSSPTALSVDTLVLLEASRNEAVPGFIGAGPYLFQIDAGLGTQADTVSVTLHEGAAVLLQQDSVKVDLDGWVRLLYTQALAGEYQIELQWTDGAGAPQSLRYSFVVQSR